LGGNGSRGAFPRLFDRFLTVPRYSAATLSAPPAKTQVVYVGADPFVLPSVARTCYGRPVAISKPLRLSVLEAMASATPVVAGRIGGVPEVVVDGVTGFLVERGDVDALHDRFAALLSDRLARRLGDNTRAAVTARFTWEAWAGAMPGRLPRAGHVTGAP
jgi:glycosyltransferase involved in cell wall biosynthesis